MNFEHQEVVVAGTIPYKHKLFANLTMTEWVLRITDVHPARWKTVEPMWEDEQIVVTSAHSFNDLMSELCDTAIKSRREYDHGINDHMWNMKVMPLSDAVDPHLHERRMMMMLDADSDDEDKENDRKTFVIESSYHDQMSDYSEPGETIISGSTNFHEDFLPNQSVIKVTYDYRTTTALYLKVISIKRNSEARLSLIQYFTLEYNDEQLMKDLQGVPAYKLPLEQQVDHFFPIAAKAFLGYYIPVYKRTADEGEAYDHQPLEQNEKVIGSMTVGLSS